MKNIIKKIKAPLSGLLEYVSYLVALILFVILAAINPMFFTAYNISNILTEMAPLLILSLGVTYVLLIGSIDLSIGAIASCSCVLFASLVPTSGILALAVALSFGLFAGLVSGALYVKLKIPSFITTFGTMSIWQSLALVFSGGAPKQISGEFKEWTSWYLVQIGPVTLPFIIAIALLVIFWIVEKRTKFGRNLYAIGGNESAARAVGLPIDFAKITVFVIMGLLSGVAGIFLASNLKSGIPTVGDPFTLYAIAAVALGGTALSGGKGGVVKTLAGVLLVVMIRNGMNVIGVDVFYQNITFGAIILVALLVTTDRKRRSLIVK
jgi:ribose/xylose/arabinose/galactoside ABC-type transport system permease subunit